MCPLSIKLMRACLTSHFRFIRCPLLREDFLLGFGAILEIVLLQEYGDIILNYVLNFMITV